jgi:hypothetical protein
MLLTMGCKKATEVSSSYAYTTFETECLGVELDGSQTLRAWGKGKNKSDAIEQAKKNAVRDVIFKGINAGSGECNQRPLITEVNAQEKYEQYFNQFFKDGGEYRKFVNMKDEKSTSRLKSTSSSQENYGVVVRVLRSDLRQQLINDNIIIP